MRKKIAVSSLKPGMEVVDTGLSWIEHPYLYSKPGVIVSQEQVDVLMHEGFTEAFIEADSDPDACSVSRQSMEEIVGRAMDLQAVAKAWEPYAQTGPAVSLQEELGPASRIYADSLKLARDCISDIRMGKQIDYAASEELVDEVIHSVMRNTDALISLTKLRASDEYTYTHSINVAVLTLGFAKHLNFPAEGLQDLGLAALFHDMGKARIPEKILNKPGRLTEEEFGVIKKHPEKGVELLEERPEVNDNILKGVAEHHEKYSGRGYPRGLAAEGISLFGSLISLADVYDALTSQRVYKKGIQPNKAMGTIFSMKGQDFFPEHVVHFVRYLGIYPIGSMVQLSSGGYGLVVSPNADNPLRPNIKIVLDASRRACAPQDIDLSLLEAEADEGLKIVESLDPKDFGVDPAEHLLPL